MISLTQNAIDKIKEILSTETTDSKLRIYVKGGGCTGMQYGFSIESEVAEDDTLLEFDGIGVLIDSTSSQYLDGSEVSYNSSLAGSSFAVKNPNATAKCGCGSSFAV